MDIKSVFNDFARTFEKKIDKDYFIKLRFEIYDVENGIWQVDVSGGNVFVYNEEKIAPEGYSSVFDMYMFVRNGLIIVSYGNKPKEK
jgi:hypothetical protein